MILIADAGSTKCDWILLKENGGEFLRTRTKGLNPAVFEISVLEKRIKENEDLKKHVTDISEIYFYGAGCGTEIPRLNLQELLASYFTNAKISVKEDMDAAVFSVTTKPGIVCILGTGSNSCYFDGEKIINLIPSLGYILMDEASGNYFGKKLIRDYYYNKMSDEIATAFEKKFDLNADTIKLNIYKKENPNTYLASFAAFIFSNEMNPYFEKVLRKGMKDFFKNRIKPYKKAKKVPIHFIGSIAHFSSKIIHEVADSYNFTIGNIVQRPIDGLIKYHQEKIYNQI